MQIPKIHANFKIAGLLVGLATVAAQVVAVGSGIAHPNATETAVVSAATTISLILAALGVHPGDSTK